MRGAVCLAFLLAASGCLGATGQNEPEYGSETVNKTPWQPGYWWAYDTHVEWDRDVTTDGIASVSTESENLGPLTVRAVRDFSVAGADYWIMVTGRDVYVDSDIAAPFLSVDRHEPVVARDADLAMSQSYSMFDFTCGRTVAGDYDCGHMLDPETGLAYAYEMPEGRVLQFPLEKGATWTIDDTFLGAGLTARVLGTHAVTTPAGSFDAVRIQYTQDPPNLSEMRAEMEASGATVDRFALVIDITTTVDYSADVAAFIALDRTFHIQSDVSFTTADGEHIEGTSDVRMHATTQLIDYGLEATEPWTDDEILLYYDEEPIQLAPEVEEPPVTSPGGSPDGGEPGITTPTTSTVVAVQSHPTNLAAEDEPTVEFEAFVDGPTPDELRWRLEVDEFYWEEYAMHVGPSFEHTFDVPAHYRVVVEAWKDDVMVASDDGELITVTYEATETQPCLSVGVVTVDVLDPCGAVTFPVGPGSHRVRVDVTHGPTATLIPCPRLVIADNAGDEVTSNFAWLDLFGGWAETLSGFGHEPGDWTATWHPTSQVDEVTYDVIVEPVGNYGGPGGNGC